VGVGDAPGGESLSEALSERLGSAGWLTEDTDAYGRDWLGRVAHRPLGVARPADTDEVSAVLDLAGRHGAAVTPQGGNTSLCAGAVPGAPGEIVLSLERMNRIEHIDGDGPSATVQAGVVLADLHTQLSDQALAFPLHLGAEGSARIGGLIATNAGGSHAARHGMMADRVLGLEVVLPDGRVWDGLRAVQKDNAGYALKRLFCGAEGTLGVITRAVLSLAPMPRQRATALLACPDLAAAARTGRALSRRLGELVDALEFFTDIGLGWALAHVDGLVWPLDERSAAYVLVELAATAEALPLDELLEQGLAQAMEAGDVLDGAIATSEAQRAMFWRLREEMPEGQRLEGVQLKHDVSVPIAALAEFVERTSAALRQCLPGVRINPFGHLADGNVHFNLSPPDDQASFGDAAPALSDLLYRAAVASGGSFAAEHGLGRSKVGMADTLRDPVERELMRSLKRTLDPNGVLNPGVIVDR